MSSERLRLRDEQHEALAPPFADSVLYVFTHSIEAAARQISVRACSAPSELPENECKPCRGALVLWARVHAELASKAELDSAASTFPGACIAKSSRLGMAAHMRSTGHMGQCQVKSRFEATEFFSRRSCGYELE